MSYGSSLRATSRRVADVVGRIFRGAAPGDIPIEQPTTFRLVVNAGTARATGIELPKVPVVACRRGDPVKRRRICAALAALPLAAALPVRGQTGAPFRIAWVTTDRKDAPLPNLDAFRAGLADLGHVEGKNVAIEVWSGGARVKASARWRAGSSPPAPTWSSRPAALRCSR